MRVAKPSRRLAIILTIVLLIVVATGLYVWQSIAAWAAYERRLTAEQATYTQLQASATTGTAAERLQAIRTLDDRLTDRGNLCHINALYAWQASVVPALRDGVESCQSAAKRLNTLAGPLGALRDYLDTAEQVSETIAGLTPSGPLTEKNWAEQGLEKARQAQESIGTLQVSDKDAKELVEQAKGLSDRLVKAWRDLLSANEAKDKAAFLTASAGVAKAYVDFAGLADTADAHITEKADKALKAASTATNS